MKKDLFKKDFNKNSVIFNFCTLSVYIPIKNESLKL